jgi:hypothetical protein
MTAVPGERMAVRTMEEGLDGPQHDAGTRRR